MVIVSFIFVYVVVCILLWCRRMTTGVETINQLNQSITINPVGADYSKRTVLGHRC